MKYLISLSGLLVLLVVFNTGCSNAADTKTAAAASLTKDSASLAGTDHTTVAKDSAVTAFTASTAIDTADNFFLKKAASANLLEMALAELASTNGKSPAVKRFATMMASDYTESNTNLINTVHQLHTAVPDSMLPDHSRRKIILGDKKGAAFDKAYIQTVMVTCKENMETIEKASSSSNALVRNFAGYLLPVLKKQLDSVNAIVQGRK